MKFSTLLFSALLISSSSYAHEFKIGDLKIGHPFARTTVAAQSAGAAYLSIENLGQKGDKLIAASSPAAKSVELHTMTMDGDVMKMREVSAIEIAPQATVTMKPGMGFHLMLMGLKQPLTLGARVPLQLQFEKAGKLDVTLVVEAPTVK